jgi:hypothetical protein
MPPRGRGTDRETPSPRRRAWHSGRLALGRAAIDDLLDRGDLADWTPLAAAILEDPYGTLAETVRELCAAHPMYGTSLLWRSWIDRLRQASTQPTELPRAAPGRAAYRSGPDAGSGREPRRDSAVRRLEARAPRRLSTLERYVSATGGRLHLVAEYPDVSYEIRP